MKNKIEFDYKELDFRLTKKAYRLSDVADKVEKVAFDVVKFKDGDFSHLWQVNKADDGNEYIVALYNDDEQIEKTASLKNNWTILKDKENIHIVYKNEPIAKFAASYLGIKESDLDLVEEYLPNKLATNKSLVEKLLKSVGKFKKEELARKYPELF